MRKLLSLSLGLLTAASALATVKNITIPAVPDGNKRCGFVVKEIPTNLGLTDDQHKAIEEELVGWTWGAYSAMEDNMVYSLSNGGDNIIHGATFIDSLSSNDTINVVISAGKMPELHIQDTVVCASENLHAISLPTYKNGTVWIKNYFTGEYEEVESLTYSYFASVWRPKEPNPMIFNKDSLFQYFDHNLYRELNVQPIDTIAWNKYIDLLGDPILNTPATSNIYMFTMSDTVTGCHANMSAVIGVDDCYSSVMWINYDGPKEISVSDESEIWTLLNNDSIMLIDPRLDCICPLPLDTIVESTQSDDFFACGYFMYDVTVKLTGKNGGDTITAYTVHVSFPALPLDMPEAFVPNNMGNCIFTVPEFIIPEPDCICPSFYYLSDMTPNAGDTITKDTPIIFTFTSACGDTIVTQTNILLPKLSVNVVRDTVYAHDSLPILSKEIVDITGKRWMYNVFTQKYEYGFVPYILDVYRDSIISENKVWGDGIPKDQLYILDNGNKSGGYYYVATDTLSGCQDTAWTYITVLSIDTTSAPVIPTEISEVKGDVYTITGILVKKDVYLKEIMNDLKDGLYIFNKQKIFVRRR